MGVDTRREDGWWELRYAGQTHCADAAGLTICVDAPGTEWTIEAEINWHVFAALWSQVSHPRQRECFAVVPQRSSGWPAASWLVRPPGILRCMGNAELALQADHPLPGGVVGGLSFILPEPLIEALQAVRCAIYDESEGIDP